MNDPAVRIEHGYYLIDTDAWVDQRVGDRAEQDTTLLREFIGHHLFREQAMPVDVSRRAVLWCAARGWPVSEASPIYHDDQRLTRPVSVVLTAVPGPSPDAAAIVTVEHHDPVVYADITTDEGYWYQTSTVDIVCPNGHRVTWDGGHGLLGPDGADTTVTAAFGPDPHAPFQRCRHCHTDAADGDFGCDCDGWVIYCLDCAARCRLALPDVPTHRGPRTQAEPFPTPKASDRPWYG